MDRASDSGSEGWGFESLPVYQKIREGFSPLLFFAPEGTRRGRPSRRLGKKVSGGHFFRPGESP